MRRKSSAVYLIQNLVNNKMYVGGSINYRNRWSQHLSDLRRNVHKNRLLQEDYNIYGEGGFDFTVLEHLYNADIDKVTEREQVWMDMLKPEYNLDKVAGRHIGDYVRTLEAKENRRQKLIGRKQSPETIAKRVATMVKNGKHKLKRLSDEQKKYLSKINSGEGNPNYGLHRSDKTKEVMSDKMSKQEYTYQDPEGNLVVFRNMLKTSEKIGVPHWALRDLMRGKKQEYNGWRFISRRKL